MFTNKELLIGATAVMALSVSTAASAASGNWAVNADGLWSNALNWDSSTIADGVDSTATFGNVNTVSGREVTLDTARTIGNLTFSDNNRYEIVGANVLTLDVSSGPATISTTSGTHRIEIALAGNDGVQKTGNGAIELQGVNTFTGGLTINAGTVRANTTSATFGAAGTTITINGGQIHGRNTQTHNQSIVLNQANTQFVKGNNGTWSFTGDVSGTGGLTVNDSGSLGARRLELLGLNNTFTGEIVSNSQSHLLVNSLADSAGAGKIRLGRTNNNRSSIFSWGAGAASALTLDHRQIQLDGTGGSKILDNQNATATNIITVNTDLLVAQDTTQTFELRGSNAGLNTFNGVIIDGAGTLNLRKNGTGLWQLGGANTYTGNTTVDQGTLTLLDDAELRFLVGATGVNNSILGDSTLNLNGDLVFDLTGAGTTVGDSWNIVDVANLAESYGGTFQARSTLGSFSESAGVWTIAENGVGYQFEESTGVLEVVVIPEPSSLALLGLGGLLVARRRRG